MSTRATIQFKDECGVSMVYKHSDGYPSTPNRYWGILSLLAFFFYVTRKFVPEDTRFNDASMLAARFTGYLFSFASHVGYGKASNLPKWLSTGVRIVDEPTADTAYTYIVDCTQFDAKGYPMVTVIPEGEDSYPVNISEYKLNPHARKAWLKDIMEGTAPGYRTYMENLK